MTFGIIAQVTLDSCNKVFEGFWAFFLDQLTFINAVFVRIFFWKKDPSEIICVAHNFQNPWRVGEPMFKLLLKAGFRLVLPHLKI